MVDTEIDEMVAAWIGYVDMLGNWQDLITGLTPKASGCGPLYELPNPLGRPDEGFAIADMRQLSFTEPHYHPQGTWEFYIALQGTGRVFVGGKEYRISKGGIVIIPPETAHFVLPIDDLIIATIVTPSLRSGQYIRLTKSEPRVKFDQAQFSRLKAAAD